MYRRTLPQLKTAPVAVCAQRCFSAAPPGNSSGYSPPEQEKSPLAAPCARPGQRPGPPGAQGPAGWQPGCQAPGVSLKPSQPCQTASQRRARPVRPAGRSAPGPPAAPGAAGARRARPVLGGCGQGSPGSADRAQALLPGRPRSLPTLQPAPRSPSVLPRCTRVLRLLPKAKSQLRVTAGSLQLCCCTTAGFHCSVTESSNLHILPPHPYFRTRTHHGSHLETAY